MKPSARNSEPDRQRPSRAAGQSDPSAGQREQLEKSERDAKRKQPENYQEAEAESKVVSTGQASPNDVGSIHGLDNKPQEQRGR
ncbi:MAG TPA: hypothetical protein PKA20_24155 [Burkholderiaceae bacterium]|nr:hypothetical protein [Burkholderiaceae bacterium]